MGQHKYVDGVTAPAKCLTYNIHGVYGVIHLHLLFIEFRGIPTYVNFDVLKVPRKAALTQVGQWLCVLILLLHRFTKSK